MGSSKGGGSKHQGQAVTAPTVSQPPVYQAAAQNLSNAEQQFAGAPWSEPGWQGNTNAPSQNFQQQYLQQGNTASEADQSIENNLSQWLFGGGE